MADAGMDACRLNMSHCSHEMGYEIVGLIRSLEAERNQRVQIGADLRGPKLRIGDVRGGGVELRTGGRVTLTAEPCLSDASRLYVEYDSLAEDVRPGNVILLHDGFLSLKVEEVNRSEVVCSVVKGGFLRSRKGVNLPGVPLSVPSVTDKDRDDISFAVQAGVDYLLVSYARSGQHVREVRAAVRQHGADLPIVAKIERQDGVDALAEIVEEADGICIARGDLGIETALGRLPAIQREAARLCAAVGKFSMIGGQVLASMVSSPLPLRAEVIDLATIVRDRMNAVILSDETASGEYPVEAVALAAEVLQAAEGYEQRNGHPRPTLTALPPRS